MNSNFIELTLFKAGSNYKVEKGDKIAIRPEHIISFSPGTPYKLMTQYNCEIGSEIILSSGQTYYVYEDYYEIFYKVMYSHLSGQELQEAQNKCKHEWGPTEIKINKHSFGKFKVQSRICKKCKYTEWQSSPYYDESESEK